MIHRRRIPAVGVNSYIDARHLIRSGDLLAWSHRSWRSWYDIQVMAIRVFTQSEYCHVGIAWCVGRRVFVLEATGTGIRIFPLSKMLPFYWLPLLNISWTSEVESYALAQVGKPYSKWQAVAAYFGWLRPAMDDSWQCAEYAQEILRRAGLSLICPPIPTDLVRKAQEIGTPVYYLET